MEEDVTTKSIEFGSSSTALAGGNSVRTKALATRAALFISTLFRLDRSKGHLTMWGGLYS
jgi:hypothetical protein